jgi:tetratricopeptide (TPR) repeat protein
MNKLTFAQWIRSLGSIRSRLLFSAVIGKVLLYIFNPPYYLSKEALILPFHFLVALDVARVVVNSIIFIECIRIVAYRLTSSWSLKKHFGIVSALIILLAIHNVLLISSRTSIRYYNYGWSLINLKDYKRAILSLDIAVKYNPKDINAYSERGYAHRELGDLVSALNDYNKVIEMDSRNASGYEGKGYVYYYMSDCDNALKEWKAAIALDPQRSTRLEKWLKNCK